MSEPRVTLLGYEAIEARSDRLVWYVTPRSHVRVHVEPVGRRAHAELALTFGGERIAHVDAIERHLEGAIISLGVGRVPRHGEGELTLHHGHPVWRWPVRFVLGYDDCQAVRLVGDETLLNTDERAALAAWVGQLKGVEQMWGHHRLARAAMGAGEYDEAVRAWRRAATTAESIGSPTWAARFLRPAAHILGETLGMLDEVERLLAEIEVLALPEDVEGKLKLDYARGLLAGRLGEPMQGASLIDAAISRATRWATSQGFIDSLEAGRRTIIGEDSEGPRPLMGSDHLTSRAAAVHMINGAWSVLVRAYRHGASAALDDANALLQAALARLPAGADPELVARAHVNLAWSAWVARRFAEARAHLERGRATLDAAMLDAPARRELMLLDGRLTLAEGRPAEARALLETLRIRLAATGSAADGGLEWAAVHAEGQTWLVEGRAAEAMQCFDAASELLDRLVDSMSMTQRGLFFQARTPMFDPIMLGDDTTDAHRALGRPEQAFAALDAACARARAGVWVSSRAERLPEERRPEWRALRAKLDAQRAEGLTQRRARGRSADGRRRLLALHGQALRRTWESMRALMVRTAPMGLVGVSPAEAAGALASDEALLFDWRRADGQCARWWIYPDRPACRGAADLRDGIDDRLAGVAHLYVIAGPGAASWSALPEVQLANGTPLAAHVGLAYLPSGATLLEDWPAPSGPPVVIVDPRLDLPHAHRDGPWIAERLGARLLSGDGADGPTVRAALRGASWVHFSGHGEPSVGTRDGAELQLAGGHTLRAEEVACEPPGPVGVVLNGCDTGGAFASHALSLPAAFLAAGAMQVLATIRPVPDEAASVFVRAFYRCGGVRDAASALREAVADAVRRDDPIWRAWRLIGRRRPSA